MIARGADDILYSVRYKYVIRNSVCNRATINGEFKDKELWYNCFGCVIWQHKQDNSDYYWLHTRNPSLLSVYK